jgi:hypothetical protein
MKNFPTHSVQTDNTGAEGRVVGGINEEKKRHQINIK